jgi:hypothetical protein
MGQLDSDCTGPTQEKLDGAGQPAPLGDARVEFLLGSLLLGVAVQLDTFERQTLKPVFHFIG